MKYPGGQNDNILNPFEIRNGKTIYRNVSAGPTASEGSSIDQFNAFEVRSVGFRAPMNIVGWGYDLFGRPVPNSLSTILGMNGQENSEQDYFGQYFETDTNDKAPVPYGGESSPLKYVGGGLDVRYDIRHGLWKGDHSFLAEIIGYKTRPVSQESSYIREYEWREVEFGNKFSDDPFRRGSYSENYGSAFTSDELLYPARSYYLPESGVINPAINIAEVGFMSVTVDGENITKSGKPVYCQPVTSGTIVEIKAVSSHDGEGNIGPSYIFNRPTDNYIIVRLTNASPLTEGLDDTGVTEGSSPGRQKIGTIENPITRWVYSGVPQKFVSLEVGQNPPTDYESIYMQGIGYFVDDDSYPVDQVELINLTEYGNTTSDLINIRRSGNQSALVAPGVNLSIAQYPSGYAMRPIAYTNQEGNSYPGTFVKAYYLEDQSANSLKLFPPTFYFSMANAHDGCCSAGEYYCQG